MAQRHSFYFDKDLVEVIRPNFDNPDGSSKTYTLVLKNGKQIKFPCRGPQDFALFETLVNNHADFKALKSQLGK